MFFSHSSIFQQHFHAAEPRASASHTINYKPIQFLKIAASF